MYFNSLRSRTGFCIYSESSADLGKFINSLRNSPIQFYGLTFRRDKLYGYVRSGNYERLERLASEHSLICERTEERGIYFVTKGYHLRFGIIAGFLLSLIMLWVMSDRVTRIDIGGNERVTEEELLSLLRDTGIYVGSRISDIDLRAAERQIVGMDKDIAWVGIRHTGSRVVVEIDEINPIPEMERSNTPCNIVAARDCQIKQVRVYSGMLIPMVGDSVRKGDVIISGVVDTKYGRSFYVHAMGEITGVYREKMTFSQPLHDTERIHTGNAVKKAVSIFGKRIVYHREGKVTGEYEYYEEEAPLRIGKITFPISLVTMHYSLTEEVTVTRTAEEAFRLCENRIKNYEENFLSGDVTVTDREIVRKDSENAVTVTVVFTVEGEVGTDHSIFAKYEGREQPEAPKKEAD